MPQWNCGCAVCNAARAGRIPLRTQSSVAVSADGERWYLVNASPDLRAQLLAAPWLAPRGARDSRIEAVLLTNADLDHTLGLFLLREGGALAVHATASVQSSLTTALHASAVLAPFGGIEWRELRESPVALLDRAGNSAGLTCRAIPLPARAPLYDPAPPSEVGHSVALEILDEASAARLLIAPDVGAITPALAEAVRNSDAVLFDGTFWSDDELRAIRPGARTSREMGHVPIDSGSLALLRESGARDKAYVHINNTNPILLPDSPERRAVEAAGVRIPEDGEEFAL